MEIVRSIFWWSITLATLIVVDDLLVGPMFWTLSVWSAPGATLIAFVVSLAAQTWLVRASIKPEPGRIARAMLNRLLLGHKNKEIAARELSFKNRSVTLTGAIFSTLVVGSVIPTIVLAKQGIDVARITYLLACIYAIEFAAIHGGYGLGGLARLVLLRS